MKEAISNGAPAHTEVQWDREEMKPIVLTGVLSDESFGPVVCVVPFQQEGGSSQNGEFNRLRLEYQCMDR